MKTIILFSQNSPVLEKVNLNPIASQIQLYKKRMDLRRTKILLQPFLTFGVLLIMCNVKFFE